MTQRQEIAIDGVVVIVTMALLIVTIFGARGVVREFLALGFVAFVPGWALLDHVELARGTGKVALAVVLSLSLAIAATSGMLWAHEWRPMFLLFAAVASSVVAVGWHLVELRKVSLR